MKLKKYYKSGESISVRIYKVFLILYIFTTFNREFVLGGLDLRYVGFGLELILITLAILRTNGKFCVNKSEGKLLLLYLIMIVSNVSWLWNQIRFNDEIVINLWILNIYNFFALIVFIIYKNKMESELVYKTIIISALVMVFSMVWIFLGQELPTFFSTGARSLTLDTGSGEHQNIFGQSIRIAGFAEDANYAAFFGMIAIATVLIYVRKRYLKVLLIAVFIFSEGLSFSRTVILAGAAALVFFFLRKALKNGTHLFDGCLVYGIVLVCLIVPFLDFGDILLTVSTRFTMWQKAAMLFSKNVLLGSGTGSFRCYHASFYNNSWAVQCHCTWWQMLSEHGIFGIILLLSYLKSALDICKNDNYKRFLLILFIVFACSFETVYLQLFVLVLYILQEVRNRGISA